MVLSSQNKKGNNPEYAVVVVTDFWEFIEHVGITIKHSTEGVDRHFCKVKRLWYFNLVQFILSGLLWSPSQILYPPPRSRKGIIGMAFVCLSVRPSVRSSSCQSICPSRYHLLNHWAEFYQTCYISFPHGKVVLEQHYFSVRPSVRASVTLYPPKQLGGI